MAMRIGCDNLVYAVMTTEDMYEAAPVYGTIKKAPGVMSININPNVSLATAFYDDGPGESASTLGNIDVAIQKSVLTAENKADLLGHILDDNGGVVYGSNDIPPFVAIGFRTLKSNGKYRYAWLYKGKFADPEDNNETKADSINFQSDTINGQFVKLSYPIVLAGEAKTIWKYEIDADTSSANASIMADWFNSVQYPNALTPTPAPTLSITWAAGSATDTTKATIDSAAGVDNKFVYTISAASTSVPSVGSVITGITDYTSGSDIPGVEVDKYVCIYEVVTLTNAVVKFAEKKLEAIHIG